MRAFIVAIVLLIPFSTLHAAEDPIPQAVLEEYNRSCIAQCQANDKSWTYCNRTCGCMTEEISRNWTKSEYAQRSAVMAKDEKADAMRQEMSRLARHCARRN